MSRRQKLSKLLNHPKALVGKPKMFVFLPKLHIMGKFSSQFFYGIFRSPNNQKHKPILLLPVL